MPQLFDLITDLEDDTSSDQDDMFLHGYVSREDLTKILIAITVSTFAPAILRKLADLREQGFTVDARDSRLNTDFVGKFMIVEHLSGWDGAPTKTAENGPWCIVGDNLSALVIEAHDHAATPPAPAESPLQKIRHDLEIQIERLSAVVANGNGSNQAKYNEGRLQGMKSTLLMISGYPESKWFKP